MPPHRRGGGNKGVNVDRSVRQSRKPPGTSGRQYSRSQSHGEQHSYGHQSKIDVLSTFDFQATYQKNAKVISWGAAVYKVHAPNCHCRIVAKLRDDHVAASSTDIVNKMSELGIKERSNPFDNLIVLPHARYGESVGSVYVCEGTNTKAYEKDARSCEKKLARELFDCSKGKKDGVVAQNEVKPGLSCAGCLLLNNKSKNGFVAIISDSLKELETTVDVARKSTLKKEQAVDHAHFTVALEVSTLQSLLQGGSPVEHQDLVEAFVDAFQHSSSSHANEAMNVLASKKPVQVKLGHHISYLLEHIKSQSTSFVLDNAHLKYVMVIGYIDSPTEFKIDLTGGKRHLGESTLECAVRETAEECSLKIDKDWLACRVTNEYVHEEDASSEVKVPKSLRYTRDGSSEVKVLGLSGGVNVFFVMTPPPAN